VIQQRVAEWVFTHEDADALAHAAALRRAATFIRAHAGLFPGAVRAHSATAAAVLAVKVYPLFLPIEPQVPADQMVRAVMEAARAFDRGVT
jgi:hypothetical protein